MIIIAVGPEDGYIARSLHAIFGRFRPVQRALTLLDDCILGSFFGLLLLELFVCGRLRYDV